MRLSVHEGGSGDRIMKRRTIVQSVMGLAACAAVGFSAYASNGVGFNNHGDAVFISKGSVQSLFNWNNNQFQACVGANGGTGCLEFQLVKESGTSWRCIRFNNNQTVVQERSSTFTLSELGTVTARLNNQVTGFHLWNANVLDNIAVGDAPLTCPSGSGWAVVTHCNVIDAQGNFSGEIIEGCTDNTAGARWTTGGGTVQLKVRANSAGDWQNVPFN
jgi:hypothetical protein